MISLTLKSTGLSAIAKRLSATKESVESARKKALAATDKDFRARLTTYVSAQAKIPKKAVTARLFANVLTTDEDELRIWAGAKDLSPEQVGTPSVYGSRRGGGVKSGRRKWPGAFMADVYGSGRKGAFIRLGSKKFSSDLYPTTASNTSWMSDDKRFPVIRAAVAIEDIMADFIDANKAGLPDNFLEVFETELRKEVIKV